MTDNHQTPSSGWREWSKFVLSALKKTEENHNSVDARLRKIETELAVLKAKLALYVAVAATITVIIVESVVRLLK